MSGAAIMMMAHRLGDKGSFKTGCENFIQEHTHKVVRLNDHQDVGKLFEFYERNKEETMADLMAVGMGLPRTMLRFTLSKEVDDKARQMLGQFKNGMIGLAPDVDPDDFCKNLSRIIYGYDNISDVASYDEDTMKITLTESGETLFLVGYQQIA